MMHFFIKLIKNYNNFKIIKFKHKRRKNKNKNITLQSNLKITI
jgi:hypothetical protein